MSVNRVTLVGNLGSDPEVRTTHNGDKVCNFTVATSQRWKDKQQQQQERTEWHRITIFSPFTVEYAERNLLKGSRVFIEGELQTRKWEDSSGTTRYTTEIVLQRNRGELQFVGGKRREREELDDENDLPDFLKKPEVNKVDMDDEIPF